MFSVKSLRAEVSACNEKVAQHDREEAQDKAEQAQSDADRAQRDDQRKREEAERAARRQAEKNAQDARDNQRSADRAAREQQEAAQAAADQKAAAERYVQIQAAAAANRVARSQSPPSPPDAHVSADSAPAIVDPFGPDNGPRRASEIPPKGGLVDPFKPEPTLADPFATAARHNQSTAPTELNKFAYEASAKVIEESTTRIYDVLQGDIQRVEAQAGKTISQAKATQLVAEIRDTQSVVQTVSSVLGGAQYALLVKNIVSAESSGNRDEATEEAIKQIASDLIRRDAVAKGMTSVTLKLFGERIGPLLVRAATPTFAAGGILLDSEKTGRDPVETIHDRSGKVSLSEKQSALMIEWRGYQRVQAQTNSAPNPSLQRALWIDSNIVYNQCLEARTNCDKWKLAADQK